MAARHRPALGTIDGDGSGKPLIAPLLREALRWFNDAVAAGCDEVPLSLTQLDIFARLDVEGTTIAELARRCGIARQSAHQAVGDLVRAGLLRVDPDPSSARNKLVRPTTEGLRRLRLATAAMAGAEAELAARIGAAQVEALRAVLDLDWRQGESSVTE